jgi:hypothetical protein
VSGKQREARAAELLAAVLRSADPERAAAGEIEWLERAAESAERWQVQEEEFLARAIELMRRTEHARGAATRAATARARIEDDRRNEKQRLRKNSLARERYAERRRTEAARVDKRTGMHALAIEVDPAAYQALKLEARRRAMSIPMFLAEVVGADLRNASALPTSDQPRWRRTGVGRRANKHARIAIEDEAWAALHEDAIQRAVTVGRRIGMAIEGRSNGWRVPTHTAAQPTPRW